MEYEYGSEELEQMATDATENGGFAQAVVKIYRKRISLIENARDERDFYAMKSLHYEKLKGKRSHQKSMRINKQLRLVVEIKRANRENVVRIVSIEDYH